MTVARTARDEHSLPGASDASATPGPLPTCADDAVRGVVVLPGGCGEFEPAVRAVDVVRVYGEGQASVRAVDGVNIEFARGRFTAVMGPSGSGKSTLLHCLAGLDQVSSGRVFLGDLELSALGEADLTRARRDRIGFVFQSFNLVSTLTAAENITLPMAIAGRKPDPDWVDHVVERLGLCDRLAHRPAELSGGQQQRVAARASTGEPSRGRVRRRARGQPRPAVGRRAARAARLDGPRSVADDRHGHPRPGCGRSHR